MSEVQEYLEMIAEIAEKLSNDLPLKKQVQAVKIKHLAIDAIGIIEDGGD